MEIPKALKVKLESLEDLARFASSTATMGHTTYIVHYEEDDKHIYGVFIVYRDYFRLYGLPMFYYVKLDKKLEGKYILLKADERGERIISGDGPRPGWITIPIVNLKEKPREVL